MVEYWDLYDKDRNKLEKVVKRGDYLDDDEYHLVVNAWIKNSKGEFLITQRSANKSHPLMWECTGGSAIKGETSLLAALREVKEELGIDLTNCASTFIGSTLRYYKGCPDILDVWLFNCDIPIDKVKIQEEEVNNVMWASADKIKELYCNNEFEYNAYFKEVVGIKERVYYIGFNANNAICNDNFFSGSITLYPTLEKRNIYFSDKLINDTSSDNFFQKYHDFIYNNAKKLQMEYPETYFICFNEKIRKLCQNMNDINIIRSNDSKILDMLNDKFQTRDMAKKYMPILEYSFLDKQISYEKAKEIVGSSTFVLQEKTGAGGSSTYLVTKEEDMPILNADSQYCLSKYVSNTPLNITLIIYDKDILFLPISAQLILLSNHKFKYVGGDFAYTNNLKEDIIKQINENSLNIAKEIQELGYRGILGIDYILKDGKIYFMEINPRFQASSFLISNALFDKYGINIAKLHYDALIGNNVAPIKINKIDYSFLNCNESEDFKNIKDYKILEKGYFKDNKSSVYRKIFNRSIILENTFEKENK